MELGYELILETAIYSTSMLASTNLNIAKGIARATNSLACNMGNLRLFRDRVIPVSYHLVSLWLDVTQAGGLGGSRSLVLLRGLMALI